MYVKGRVAKEPFLEWFMKMKEQMAPHFEQSQEDRKVEGSAAGGSGWRKGGLEAFVFDATRFAYWCGITRVEYEKIQKINSDPTRKTIDLGLVDRVITCVSADPYLLETLYPLPEELGEGEQEPLAA